MQGSTQGTHSSPKYTILVITKNTFYVPVVNSHNMQCLYVYVISKQLLSLSTILQIHSFTKKILKQLSALGFFFFKLRCRGYLYDVVLGPH